MERWLPTLRRSHDRNDGDLRGPGAFGPIGTNDPLLRITIPHKILSYTGSGKPILAALAGDGVDLVTAARA